MQWALAGVADAQGALPADRTEVSQHFVGTSQILVGIVAGNFRYSPEASGFSKKKEKTYHKQVLAHVVGLLAAAVGAAALIGAVRLCRKPKEAALLDRGSQAKFGLNLS